MNRIALLVSLLVVSVAPAAAQNMILTTSNADYQINNVFSDVSVFNFHIEIDAPLATGAYVNPDIVSVTYQVTGSLEPGTPSGFPAFDLQRTISGAEFYSQGSSLSFEIAASAVLTDGVQVQEMVGNGIVFTFNGREVDTGRFHPALLELNLNGSGRLQNSNNEPDLLFGGEIGFGEEYITDLAFDPGNATLIAGTPRARQGGGGAVRPLDLALLILFVMTAGVSRVRGQLAAANR